MDKGIRPVAREYFVQQNELRRRGEGGYVGPKANTLFRKNVIFHLIEQFGCSVASACTHYNEAFKLVKAATPELVAGLGRPEDKKGGRKRKVQPAQPAPVATVIPTPVTSLLQGFLQQPAQPAQPAQPEPVQAATLQVAPVEFIDAQMGTEQFPEEGETPAPAEQTAFTVKKRSDGSVVAEGLSFEQAKALVAAAAAAKKAKLYWV